MNHGSLSYKKNIPNFLRNKYLFCCSKATVIIKNRISIKTSSQIVQIQLFIVTVRHS